VYAETSLRVYGLWISTPNINRCLSPAVSRRLVDQVTREAEEEDWGR